MGESESGFIEVNGARPYYEVAGTGEPLVLIHAGSRTAGCGKDNSRCSPLATA